MSEGARLSRGYTTPTPCMCGISHANAARMAGRGFSRRFAPRQHLLTEATAIWWQLGILPLRFWDVRGHTKGRIRKGNAVVSGAVQWEYQASYSRIEGASFGGWRKVGGCGLGQDISRLHELRPNLA